MKCPNCGSELVGCKWLGATIGGYTITPMRTCEYCVTRVEASQTISQAFRCAADAVLSPEFPHEVGGYEVRDAIQAYGWKQPAFAERIGVSSEVLGVWLTQEALPREVIDMVRDNLRGAPPPAARAKLVMPESGANSELLRLRDELRRWHK